MLTQIGSGAAAEGNGVSLPTLVLTKDTGSATGDLAIIAVSWYCSDSGTLTQPTVSGFTSQSQIRLTNDGGTRGTYAQVFTRVLDSTEGANFSVVFSGGVGDIYGCAWLETHRGDTALSFASITAGTVASSSTTATAPSVSGTAGQGLVAVFAISDPATQTTPSGMTVGTVGLQNTNTGRCFFQTLGSTGATGAKVSTLGTARDSVGFSVLLNGASTSGASASVSGNEGADTASATAANWTTASISAAERADTAAVTANATSTVSGSIAATEGADAQAVTAANWRTAQVAVTDAANVLASTGASYLVGQLSMAWTASTDPSVTRYRVYWDTVSRGDTDYTLYANSLFVGNVTAFLLTGLAIGQTYYVNVTANDASDPGYQSGLFGEVSGTAHGVEVVSTEGKDVAAAVAVVPTVASITAAESADTTAITTARWRTAQIAGTEGVDVTASTAFTVLSTQIATTEGADVQQVSASSGSLTTAAIASAEGADTTAIAAANWTTAAISETESADVTAAAASNWTTASVTAAEGADVASAQATLGSVTNASIVSTESADVTVIAAQRWTTATISGSERADVVVGSISVTTGASVSAIEGASSVSSAAAQWITGQMFAVEGSDALASAGIAGSVTLAQAVLTEQKDVAPISAVADNTVYSSIAGIESSDALSAAGQVTTGAMIASIDAADAIVVGATPWRTAQISTSEKADAFAFAAYPGTITLGSISPTEYTDRFGFTIARWMTAQIDALESQDEYVSEAIRTAAFFASKWTASVSGLGYGRMRKQGYIVGQVARISLQVADYQGNAISPDGIDLIVETPAGTTHYADLILNPEIGEFRYDYQIQDAGSHFYRWEASGQYPGAREGAFFVYPGNLNSA